MKTALKNGIIKLEKASVLAFEANQNLNNEFEYLSEEREAKKKAEKLQVAFEKQYFALASKFKEAKEDARDYIEWETISAVEFMDEVNV